MTKNVFSPLLKYLEMEAILGFAAISSLVDPNFPFPTKQPTNERNRPTLCESWNGEAQLNP